MGNGIETHSRTETVTWRKFRDEYLWERHQSNRSEEDYNRLETEFWELLKEALGDEVGVADWTHHEYLSSWLIRQLDDWDKERIGYTFGQEVADYIRYLNDEVEEYKETPDDYKEIADVIIFASRVRAHPEATHEQKLRAVKHEIFFTNLLLRDHTHLGTPQEILAAVIEQNARNYDPAFANDIEKMLYGGLFMKGIRRNYPGNQLPTDEEMRPELSRPIINFNGRAEVKPWTVQEMKNELGVVYPNGRVPLNGEPSVSYTDDHGKQEKIEGVVYEARRAYEREQLAH